MIHGLADDRPRAPGRRSLLPAEEAPTCQCRRLGRERPSLCAARLRPGSLMRGSLTPQVSAKGSRRSLRRASRPSRRSQPESEQS
jgi:hypothetical protein